MECQQSLLKSVKRKIFFDFLPENINLPINIGYGIDHQYCRCMCTSISSICKNNYDLNFIFHIMTTDLLKDDLEKIKEVAKKFGIKIIIYQIDKEFFSNLPSQVHLPIPTYFRFILPMLLQETAKVLYIDADIICLKSIKQLFNIDMRDCIIAAVPDHQSLGCKRNVALHLINHCYFNAGVLVINIEKWNRANVVDKVMRVLAAEPKKFRYLDQDALNLILTGKIHYLDSAYNFLNADKFAQRNIVFLHFAAHPKPWNVAWPLSKFCNDFTKNIYYEYEQLTPWRGQPLEMPRNYKEMKTYAKCLMENNKYMQGISWYLKYIITKLFNK